jgi:hypothetical protein
MDEWMDCIVFIVFVLSYMFGSDDPSMHACMHAFCLILLLVGRTTRIPVPLRDCCFRTKLLLVLPYTRRFPRLHSRSYSYLPMTKAVMTISIKSPNFAIFGRIEIVTTIFMFNSTWMVSFPRFWRSIIVWRDLDSPDPCGFMCLRVLE